MLMTVYLGLQQQSVADKKWRTGKSLSTTLGKLKLCSFGAANIERNDKMTYSSFKPEAVHVIKAESTAKDQFYAMLTIMCHLHVSEATVSNFFSQMVRSHVW